MARSAWLWDRVGDLMALVAAAMLFWLMVSVVNSVIMRNIGIQPFAWLFTSSEYAILYMTMLGAPWLVRERGHVHIELVTAALPDGVRRIVSRAVALACVVVCVILAWQGWELFAKNWTRNDYDVRAYYFPKWILTITFPVAFAMMAVVSAIRDFSYTKAHGEDGCNAAGSGI